MFVNIFYTVVFLCFLYGILQASMYREMFTTLQQLFILVLSAKSSFSGVLEYEFYFIFPEIFSWLFMLLFWMFM
jgi:hypothetical protein